MKIKEAQAQIEAKQSALAALMEQKEAVTQELQAVQDKRAAAVRRLAGGDAGQRKIILDLEQQAKPLATKLEGLELLCADGQKAVEQARADLKEAQTQEAYELQNFLADRRRRECEQICASVSDRKDKIFTLWMMLNEEVAELQLARQRVKELGENGFACLHQGDAITSVDTLANEIAKRAKKDGFLPFQGPGYAGVITAWAMVKPSTAQTHYSVLDFKNIARLRAAETERKYLDEFNQKGEK